MKKLLSLATGISLAAIGVGTAFTILATPGRINAAQQVLPRLTSSQHRGKTILAERLCRTYRVTREYGLYLYIYVLDTWVNTNTIVPVGTIVTVTEVTSDASRSHIIYTDEDGNRREGWVTREWLKCYQSY